MDRETAGTAAHPAVRAPLLPCWENPDFVQCKWAQPIVIVTLFPLASNWPRDGHVTSEPPAGRLPGKNVPRNEHSAAWRTLPCFLLSAGRTRCIWWPQRAGQENLRCQPLTGSWNNLESPTFWFWYVRELKVYYLNLVFACLIICSQENDTDIKVTAEACPGEKRRDGMAGFQGSVCFTCSIKRFYKTWGFMYTCVMERNF